MWSSIGQLGQGDVDSLLKSALDAGINFIDTANVYSNGTSEVVTGQAIKNLGIAREDVVIATKVLGPMGEGVNARGASRGHMGSNAREAGFRIGWSRSPGVCLERQRKPEARSIGRAV